MPPVLPTKNVCGADVTEAAETVTLLTPMLATSPAGIDAFTWFEETKLVVCPTVFHWTAVDAVRLHPQTARATPGPPATAELGSNDRIDGGPDVGHAPGLGLAHAAAAGVAVGVAVGVTVWVAVDVG
ncbi:MAG: hypothetical protein WAN07_11110, partial [Candidatus Binatus sp.]